MPWRDWDREQVWLMPPSLDEVLADDHPARLVAALVDSLTTAEWAELGVDLAGQPLGAPAYHPRALLGIWLYGFMIGVRSARRLETAGREQLALQWLSGYQQPDHNTLWRFYQAHRNQLRGLLRHTVQIAARLGLVDWALQAVDGTKVAGSASSSRTYDARQLERLLARTERAIATWRRRTRPATSRRRRGCRLTWPKRSGCARRFGRPARRWRRASVGTST